MNPSILSLLPPLAVIAGVVATRRMNLSLAIGLISAGLIATAGAPLAAISLIATRLFNTISDVDTLYLYGSLIAISTLVMLFDATGCAATLATYASKRFNSARSAQSSSLLLSSVLFIDDYLSILTTGYVAQYITDRFSVARAKLAFLVHSLAGPLVILVPISSWVAAITTQLAQAGVGTLTKGSVIIAADPFSLYLRSVPFVFYSFFIIGGAWFIVWRSISFGPMHSREREAHRSPHTFSTANIQSTGHLIDILLPLAVLLGTMFFGILYSGKYHLFGGANSLFQAIEQNNSTFLMMCLAGVFATTSGMIIALLRRTITPRTVPQIVGRGVQLMQGAIIMVFLSSSLASMLKNDVGTGYYIASKLLGSVSLSLMPALFFIASLTTAIITGTAWGTFSLMLSIAIPMIVSLMQLSTPAAPSMIPVLFPLLGAIFSGSVAGDHLSPISETTIMTATSTNISPTDHTLTQLPYGLVTICATLVSFVVAGYLSHLPVIMNAGISLLVGFSLNCLLLTILNSRQKRKASA